VKRRPHDAQLNHAVVLLSGGMDSVAALHWAKERAATVRAIGFHYGQPNRDQETTAAQRIAKDLGVPHALIVTADTLHTGQGLLRGVADHDPAAMGVSRAFVPGRNAVFLSIAAAHAASWHPVGTIDLVIGACADDAVGFPDCRANFFVACERMLCLGYGREFRVRSPFVDRTKGQIVSEASDAARRDIARSWSCYRGDGPCGTCTPCVLRRDAFATNNLIDESRPASMHGGDPHRSWT
jgi:7-cyano-7-deazaguanine synthase